MSKQVIVLGMHRSGTSTVSMILQKLGVHIGDDLLGASPGNPYGHGEDMDFLKLNREILSYSEGTWDFPPTRNRLLKNKHNFDKKISQLISEKRKHEIWGWKEPRTCLLMPYYQSYLENPKYIIVDRDEQEVSDSLKKRNKMPIKKGKHLHNRYTQDINEFIMTLSSNDYYYINFKDLHSNSEQIIYGLINFLELSPNENEINQAKKVVKPLDVVRSKRSISKRKEILGKLNKRIKNPVDFFIIGHKHVLKIIKYYIK
ncbi:sulfotransferase family protein [Virgibacillus salinus]|uniref:sulfotransferase family protein n=1 Tax=Virgibacillus salinus TaxID=553311 RepID=UPI0011137B6F|nr:hypothetical protein [Virgibacillus salinus]